MKRPKYGLFRNLLLEETVKEVSQNLEVVLVRGRGVESAVLLSRAPTSERKLVEPKTLLDICFEEDMRHDFLCITMHRITYILARPIP
jgi:hypothetical protein